MKKELIYVLFAMLWAQAALANPGWGDKLSTPPFKYLESQKRFKSFGNYIRFASIKFFKGSDSAEAFYKKAGFNRATIDYLPLTGGTLTGDLYGTNASFSGSGSFVNNVVITADDPGKEWLTLSNSAGSRSFKLLTGINNVGNTGFSIQDVTNSNAVRLVITNAGNVGIGTPSPGAKLSVNGTGSLQGYSLSTDFGSDYSIGLGIGMPGTSPNKGVNIGYNNVADIGFIGAVQNGTSWKSISIAPIGGNVGIGTTSPGEKLSVNGNITANGDIFIGHRAALQGYSISTDFGSDYSIGLGIGMPATSPNKGIDIGYNNVADVGFIGVVQNGTAWKNLSIAPIGGYVGIGTTSPTEKLSVNGNVKAKKIIITQTGWSDYVFADNYKLRSLSSLETFLKKNKHLPSIPSAKEIAEQGVSIGDNQALLLQKVEELTLYIIGMNKEIGILKKENQQLKNKINRK